MSPPPARWPAGRRLGRRLVERLPDWPVLDHTIATLRFVADNGRLPHWRPRCRTDYIFWVKLRDLDGPLRRRITDKLLAKDHIRETLDHEACPETLAVFRRPEEIVPEALPVPAVVKATHLSGAFLWLERPAGPEEIAEIRGWLADDYYRRTRERNYRGLRAGVIAERPVAPRAALVEHKLDCRDGRVRFVWVHYDRATGTRRDALFDRDWRLLADDGHPPPEAIRARPAQYGEMIRIAERLARPFRYMRVDLYLTPERVYVGELTSAPLGAGPPTLRPESLAAASRALLG